MSRNDFISGSILQFNLPVGLGYGYCKVLDLRSIREFDGVLVKVFDHIVKEPIKSVEVLQGKDWLFGARRMPWLPATRGKRAWKFFGVLISNDDQIIPEFRYTHALSEEAGIDKPWHVLRNINQISTETYPYTSVKHLEDTVVSPQIAIEIRTGMEYLRTREIDVASKFDLDDKLNKIIYRQMENVSIYKYVPMEIRGKAIG
jgi:hypothetical protein